MPRRVITTYKAYLNARKRFRSLFWVSCNMSKRCIRNTMGILLRKLGGNTRKTRRKTKKIRGKHEENTGKARRKHGESTKKTRGKHEENTGKARRKHGEKRSRRPSFRLP